MRRNSPQNHEIHEDESDTSSSAPLEPRRSVESPHRDRHEALVARRRALALEHEDASRAVARRERLARHLEVIDHELRASAAPLLESISIASPCRVRWDDMVGTDLSRRCARCDRDVHDLSRMTRDEAHALLARADATCVLLRRRPDGRVVTADCPPPERRTLPGAIALAAAGAALGITASGVATMALSTPTADRMERRGHVVSAPIDRAPVVRTEALHPVRPVIEQPEDEVMVGSILPSSAPLEPMDLDRDVRWTAPQSWEVRRSVLERALVAPATIDASPRVLPRERDGRLSLYGIRRADLLGRLGFQNGDTILDINGYEIANPNAALEAYTELRTAPSYFVRIERRGQERLHVYRVVP